MLTRLTHTLALAFGIAAVLTVTALTRADVDLWGHLRFGLDILETRSLHSVDPYSFTSDRPWLNHEWLAEVVIALAWNLAGAPGLIFLKLACIFGALALVGATLKASGVTGRAHLMLLGLALVGILPRVTHVRPQLFSVVLFAALVHTLTRAAESRNLAHGPLAIAHSPLVWTIPIMALWANLHGGWIVGVGTVGLWCAGEAWARRATPRHAAVPLAYAAAATAATLLNPYGAGLWTFLLETVRFGREAIGEWGPAWSNRTTMIVWSCFALLTVLARLRQGSGGQATTSAGAVQRNPAPFLIPLLWGFASLRVNRLDAFFAVSVIGFLAEPLATFFSRRGVAARTLPLAWKAAAAVVALIVILSVPVSRSAFTCIGIHSTWPEPDATSFMHQRGLSGRIVTFFDWGEYAIWNMPAAMKVSMDGRRETVYSDKVVNGHLRLYLGTNDGLAYLDGLDSQFVWLPRKLPVVRTLQDRAWVPVFEGPRSIILGAPRRDGTTARTVVTGGNATAGRCFPGP